MIEAHALTTTELWDYRAGTNVGKTYIYYYIFCVGSVWRVNFL